MEKAKNIWHIDYTPKDLEELISWSYFFHAWGFPARFTPRIHYLECKGCQAGWIQSFPLEERSRASEALKLLEDAQAMLGEMAKDGLKARTVFRLCEAASIGDDLVLDGTALPLLRQQTVQGDAPLLSLSDFVRPQKEGKANDLVGVFSCSFDDRSSLENLTDDYQKILLETLSDRLAEAAAEKLHLEVRRKLWGYAKDEDLTREDILLERFQGIRPAVGYPSLPDQSVNFILDGLLDFSSIGVRLTETGAMDPHSSVSGLMIAHPKSRYFSVGRILEDQLESYARRRGMSVEDMRRFLAANIQEK